MNSPGFDGPDLDGPCCAGGAKVFKFSIRLVFFTWENSIATCIMHSGLRNQIRLVVHMVSLLI